MSAWESPGEVAAHKLHENLGLDDDTAQAAVKTVLDQLAEPDRDMLTAGAGELGLAVPKGMRGAYVRNLAAVIWRAMLERAR